MAAYIYNFCASSRDSSMPDFKQLTYAWEGPGTPFLAPPVLKSGIDTLTFRLLPSPSSTPGWQEQMEQLSLVDLPAGSTAEFRLGGQQVGSPQPIGEAPVDFEYTIPAVTKMYIMEYRIYLVVTLEDGSKEHYEVDPEMVIDIG